jgi:hypothetical protein
MLILVILVIFCKSLIANPESSQFMITDAQKSKSLNEQSSSGVQTKKIKNKNAKKNGPAYYPKRESAQVIGSIAQIVNDPRDSNNVLAAILNIITVFFKYIQHIEADNDLDYRSVGSNADMELIVTACFDLLSKLNLPDDEKYHIINEVRSKIVELNDQNINYQEQDQVEFVQLC